MAEFDLGKIVGENGAQGPQGIQGGQGVQGEQGLPGVVPEFEAGEVEIIEKGLPAEFNLEERDGKIYLNLKLPLERDMGGDMKKSIYDKNNKAIDIYEYIDKNAMTLLGGTFTGDVFLNRDPIDDTQAANKKYVDTVGKNNEESLKTFINEIKNSEMNVMKNAAGDVIYNEAVQMTKTQSANISGSNIGKKEYTKDFEKFEIDAGEINHYIKLWAEPEIKVTSSTGVTGYNGGYYLVDENGNEFGITTKDLTTIGNKVKTPGSFFVRLRVSVSSGNISSLTAQLESFTAVFEKKIIE